MKLCLDHSRGTCVLGVSKTPFCPRLFLNLIFESTYYQRQAVVPSAVDTDAVPLQLHVGYFEFKAITASKF